MLQQAHKQQHWRLHVCRSAASSLGPSAAGWRACSHTLARQVLNRSDGSHLRISCRLADPLALSSNPGRVIMMPRTTCTAECILVYMLLCLLAARMGDVSWQGEHLGTGHQLDKVQQS